MQRIGGGWGENATYPLKISGVRFTSGVENVFMAKWTQNPPHSMKKGDFCDRGPGAAMDEKRTKVSTGRWRVARWRWYAPATFGAQTARRVAAVCLWRSQAVETDRGCRKYGLCEL